jgi:hypothetical protein
MRVLKFMLWALLAILSFAPRPAVADPAYACSVAEIFECTAIAGCARVSAQQANLPPFVTLNVKEKPDCLAAMEYLTPGMSTKTRKCSSSMGGTGS